MALRVAIVFYSMYGHIEKLAQAELRGIQSAGGTADLFQFEGNLLIDVLMKSDDPPKSSVLFVKPEQLFEYDAVLFGIPTCCDNFPSQWKAFWDITSNIWASGRLWTKYAGVFVSTYPQRGSEEAICIAAMNTLTYHGLTYVPASYKSGVSHFIHLDETQTGSAWGASSYSGADGSVPPSEFELHVAEIQGKSFYEYVTKIKSLERGVGRNE